MSRHLSDDEHIELVEFLRLAFEACRAAEGLVSVALERLAGLEPDVRELRHEVLRLGAMLASVATRDLTAESWR